MPLTVYWVHFRSDLKYTKNEVSSVDNSCKNLERMRVSIPVNSQFSLTDYGLKIIAGEVERGKS